MSAARYLLDTNTLIYIRRGITEVTRAFAKLTVGEAAMSVVSYGELAYGAEKSTSRAKSFSDLAQLSSVIPVLAIGQEVADEYGLIRADLERRGKLIGANDLWIAAHARTLRLTLVSNNHREFERVRGLKLANWYTK